jgi:hypothetical protein
MKFKCGIDQTVEIIKFERLDHEKYVYVQLTREEIKTLIESFDKKKLVLIMDGSPVEGDPKDGWSLVATHTHIKKLKIKFDMDESENIACRATLACDISAPLRTDSLSPEAYRCKLIKFKFNKGEQNEVSATISTNQTLDFTVE